ncbi:hypothetical protein OG342_02095 [Streptomyces bobili]|uniref:hypothetical protein n=1 Tax=Streptomyces bobili TaxID=67280 RepID=UPI002250944C|nr:hypothetical protein [Streptomyces bobili]MCX5521670.1 hypothetical protein [Streptomyces bobili]
MDVVRGALPVREQVERESAEDPSQQGVGEALCARVMTAGTADEDHDPAGGGGKREAPAQSHRSGRNLDLATRPRPVRYGIPAAYGRSVECGATTASGDVPVGGHMRWTCGSAEVRTPLRRGLEGLGVRLLDRARFPFAP